MAVFFAIANITSLVILSAIIAVGYYWFGLSTISQGLKAIVLQQMTDTHFLEEPGLWIKQQKWMQKENLCSACGEEINPYASFCVNCGLHYKKKKNQSFSNISPTEKGVSISYTYKKPE
jgi:hypothetical protein